MFFAALHVVVVLLAASMPAAQVQYQRSYTLSPSQDTFIHSERDLFFQAEYLQVGRRRDDMDSRTLLKFSLDEFRQKSSWGSEAQYADLKSSVIRSVSLRLSCIGVSDYLRSDVRSSLFNDTIHISQILRPWDEEAVTWTIRDLQGGVWGSRGLDTSGGDATTSFLQKDVVLDYGTCQSGATLLFNINPTTFESWLSQSASFYGILVWTNLPPGVKTTLKFASMENGHMDRHPALVVSLQDTIIDSGSTCSSQEFHCVDGRCINQSKVCNFANDCLHGNDEETCSIRCNFEDQCSWDAPPIMNGIPGWVVHSGSTGTSGTGPTGGQSDTGSDVSGSYLYVDASGKGEGALTRFISPLYTESGPQCQLHFFYHMYGSDMGILRAVLAFSNQSLTIWEKAGSQLNQWLGVVLTLGRLREPFRITFEAERSGGIGEAGDIAIDSLELKDCSPDLPSEPCQAGYFRCDNTKCLHPNDVCNLQKDCLFGEEEEAEYCGVVPFGGACSFEVGWCGWTNVQQEDGFDWTRNNGSTLTKSTGPSVDHTLGTDQGFYVYTEVSSIPRSSKAFLSSVWFQAPPPETYDAYSPHHHTCKVRFFYHMYGINIGQLKLYAILNTTTESSKQLFSESAENRDMWQSYDASLPEITESYYLQFESTRGMSFRGDMALDDITLSRQCFQLDDLSRGTTTPELTTAVEITGTRGTRSTESVSSPTTLASTNAMEFHFGTCGSKGSTGPTQSMCNVAYRQQNFSVAISDGIQNWVVPKTKAYSFKVRGAGGGTGVENTSPTRGADMEASFNLVAGDQLLILVGQKGEDACDNGGLPNFGQGGFCNSQLTNDQRNLFGEGGHLAGGGGGGGGGTFIAKLNASSGEYVLLVVAGGGGGLSFSPGLAPDDVHGSVGEPGPGVSGQQASTNDVSGAGGGWNSTGANMTQVSGMSFVQGGQGGRQCALAHIEADWRTQGGFGGGGGGCTNGGGGGGFTGGDAPLMKDLFGSGQGGTSYVHPTGFDVRGKSGSNSGTGEVVITALVLCPAGTTLNQAKEACVVVVPSKLAAVVGSIVPVFIIIVCIVLFIVLVLNRRKKKTARETTERIDTADYQLNQLRHNASMDFNPCYQLGDGAVTIKDLMELPRENLKLIRALGQGAFGEVYHGAFQPADEKEPLPVAVKTLPERCTEQDESDFLMEALIMGNFDHPNVVSLKGVCFTQAPRFILLEFMAGGELKQFLRDSRPRRGQPSPLDMSDLLLAAHDVAKGCEYLESRRFIHRDIAARNVLLSSKEKGRTAKIGDFGMARDIYRADYYRKGGQAMLPVKWMPPEAFLDGIFTSKTDVWSYGVLLWEIMSLGYMPYPGMSNQEVIFFTTQGQRMNAPRNCPRPIQDLMSLCWQQAADDRPSFSTILQYLADFMKNPSIMNAPLPQELLDDGRPPSINRPRNSKTSPVLKVPGSSGQAFDTALASSTAGEGDDSTVEDDGEPYLTPDWVPGGRMKEHLLMKDGNINNSAYCVNGAHGGVPLQEADRPGHESVNQLKESREGNIRHRDSDTSFDPPINQDEQANEFTDFLDKGDEDVDEISSTRGRPRVPPLDFSGLANGHLQDSSPHGIRKVEPDEVEGQAFVKSSTPRNSSRSVSNCDSCRPAKRSLPDSTPPVTHEASQDECCSSRSEDQSTTQSAREPGPSGTQDHSTSSSFSPRILNRLRLPVFSRHISLEVPSSQPSGTSNSSLPMLNRMQSMPVSPNPYTMTELSSQGGQASGNPSILDDGVSNVASRRVLFNSQSGQVVFDDDEPNGAVV